MANDPGIGREGHRQRRASHRRQAPGGAARAGRAALPGPPADRGRARHRQDRAGQGHRARASAARFRRIQFTPDLLPTDVTGLSIYNQKTQEFEFRPGPDHGPDRARRRDQPRHAQDAVGAARVHGRAPGDGRRRDLPDADRRSWSSRTQNPIEYEGTFALPEAQLDRFMLRLHLGYPQPLEEIVILDEQKRTHPIEELEEVAPRRRAARDAGRRARDLRRLGRSATTSSGSSTRRATTPTSTSAPRRAARSRSIAPARRTPR